MKGVVGGPGGKCDPRRLRRYNFAITAAISTARKISNRIA